MALAEHDDVVETLTADRSYQALEEGVLPRRARGAHDLLDVHTCEPVAEGRAVDAVAIPHQVLRCAVIWERFDDLLRSPSSGRVVGDVEMQDAAAIVGQDDKDVEDAKGRGRDGEEVDRGECTDVIRKEGAPGLGRRLAWPVWHQTRDLAFGDLDAELEQLAVDTRRAPERVCVRHVPNEVVGAAIGRWASGWSPGTPSPKVREGRAMPANDGGGLHDHEGAAPSGPGTNEPDPEEAVGPVEQRTRSATLKNGKLLTEGEVLKSEVGPGSERRPGCGKYGEQERKHAAIYHPRAISCGRTETRRISCGSSSGEAQRDSTTQNARSIGLSRCLAPSRIRVASCWRSARFSVTTLAREQKAATNEPMTASTSASITPGSRPQVLLSPANRSRESDTLVCRRVSLRPAKRLTKRIFGHHNDYST